MRFATFDCYGTLIDWEGGAASFLYELARRHERDPRRFPGFPFVFKLDKTHGSM